MNKCKLCDSEWGNHWQTINGEKLFFCCNVCARQYHVVVKAVQFHTGWSKIDEIIFNGSSRKRNGTAFSNAKKMNFIVSFLADGSIWSFSPK